MKITNMMLMALLSTSMMMAHFDDIADGVEQGIDAIKGQTRAENSTLIANNKQTNADVEQSGLINENVVGSIEIASGTNLSNADIRAENNENNTKVKQSGLVNKNLKGSVKIK
jgi:hypothetical protein